MASTTTDSKIRTRQCSECKLMREEPFFPKTSSKFFPGGRSIICLTCLEKMVNYNDWNTVDKILQWLDLPFDINMWVKLQATSGTKTLSAYLNLLETTISYHTLDWTELNEKWKLAQQLSTMDAEVEFLTQDWLRRMEIRWPGNYDKEDFLYLEQTHERLCATQNIITGLQQENAKIIAQLLLVINKKIRQTQDPKKEIDSYNALVKASGFEPQNAKNMGDFNSVGELVRWLEKRGWKAKYAHESRDVVDFTIDNYKQYIRRLIAGEPDIAEQVETQREVFATAADLEKEIDEGHIVMGTEEAIEYEDRDELEYELSDYDD